MEIPSIDQGALITVLGVIGAALAAIARGLFQLLNHYIDKAKVEGEKQGAILAKLETLDEDVRELKKDINGIAALMGTARSKGERGEND